MRWRVMPPAEALRSRVICSAGSLLQTLRYMRGGMCIDTSTISDANCALAVSNACSACSSTSRAFGTWGWLRPQRVMLVICH